MKAVSALLLLSSLCHAESVVTVERADVAVLVQLSGTIVPGEKQTLKAGFAGRIEALPIPSQSPFRKKSTLAIIAGRDLAAIIDANATTAQQIVEERWQKVYRPNRTRAPFDGFLLETRAGIKEYVKADQILFVVTPNLSFESIVPLSGTPGMSSGMRAMLWRPSNPELKMPGRVKEVLPGVPTPGRATIRVELLPAEDVAMPLPGTVMDGQITVAEKKSVITVPAGAVRHAEGRSFVCAEIEEGLSDGVRTHVTRGLVPGQPILTTP